MTVPLIGSYPGNFNFHSKFGTVPARVGNLQLPLDFFPARTRFVENLFQQGAAACLHIGRRFCRRLPT